MKLRALSLSVLLVLSVVTPVTPVESGVASAVGNQNADGTVDLGRTVYSEERGDVLAVSLSVYNTDTATITVGTVTENDWSQNVTVRDGNEDGTITLQFNTYTAGTSDNTDGTGNQYVVYSVANETDSVETVTPANGGFDPDAPGEATLPAGDYRLRAVAGAEPANGTTADATAILSLADRSTDGLETFVAPGSRTLDDTGALSDALDRDQLTVASTVADGDQIVWRIDASGLSGPLAAARDAGAANTTDAFLSLTASHRNAATAPNAALDATWDLRAPRTNGDDTLSFDHSTLDLVADAANDEYWLVYDTGETNALADGDTFETNLTVQAEASLADTDQTVTDGWTAVEPTATVDTNADVDDDGTGDEIGVPQAASRSITGTSTVAPGTPLTVEVTGTDTGSPFPKTLSTVVQSDGTWLVRSDFSDNAQGANFTVDVRREVTDTSLLAEPVDGRIGTPLTASVFMNDQASSGLTVTVDAVELSDGGFVALHRNDANGEVVGNSSYLESGPHSDVEITLEERLTTDTTLVAMVHQDTDGDEVYEFERGSSLDAPYLEDGSAVTDSATVDIVLPGSGTAEDPYRVATWTQLDIVRDDLDAHYVLVADLDKTIAGYDAVASPSANNGTGFEPIGNLSTPFTGSFDGNGHTIADLTIDRPSRSFVGLFGRIGSDGTIEDVGLENASVTGKNQVGGLVGETYLSTVRRAAVSGTVTGSSNVGGLVGENLGGTVVESYATADVVGNGSSTGGLVGYNAGAAEVNASYATGSVIGPTGVGGLVGTDEQSTIRQSYAVGIGQVFATDSDGAVGGLVGRDSYDSGTVASSYWDTDSTGQLNSVGGGTGLATGQMQGLEAQKNMSDLDFSTVWATVDADNDADVSVDDYPVLQAVDRATQLEART